MDMLTGTALAETFLGHIKAGRMDRALEHLHPDLITVEAESLPFGGTYRGPQGFVDLMTKIGATLKLEEFTLNDVTAEGDYVALHITMKGSINGNAFRTPLCEVWKLQGGRIIEITPYYYDTKYLLDTAAGKTGKIPEAAFSSLIPPGQSKGADKSKGVLKDVLEAIFSDTPERAKPLLDDSFCVIWAPNLPYAGEFSGPTAFTDVQAKLYEAWGETFKVITNHMIADDKRVVMLHTMTGVLGGTYLEIPMCEVCEMKDGKLGRVLPHYFDVQKMYDLYTQRK